MLIEDTIRQKANEIAGRERQRAEYLHEEYLSLRAQASHLKSRRDAARAAPERVASFRAKLGAGYHCPACWVIRNSPSLLVQTSGSSGSIIFECHECNYIITTENGDT